MYYAIWPRRCGLDEDFALCVCKKTDALLEKSYGNAWELRVSARVRKRCCCERNDSKLGTFLSFEVTGSDSRAPPRDPMLASMTYERTKIEFSLLLLQNSKNVTRQQHNLQVKA